MVGEWGDMHGGGTCMAGYTATAADDTHPTGMHSCLLIFLFLSFFAFFRGYESFLWDH